MIEIPKYDFKCDKCGNVEEYRVFLEQKDELFLCRNCGTRTMKRIFSPQGIVFHNKMGCKPKVRAKVKKMGL